MNCDEAFDALTDPTESNHSALKWHLEFCPRCREMQEVLAPALAMFSGDPQGALDSAFPSPRHLESPSERESRLPPTENGNRSRSKPFLTTEAVRVAEQTARALRPARKPAAIRFLMVGVVCLLTALGVFFAIHATSEPGAPPSNATMLADKCLWTERDDSTPTQPAGERGSSRWVVLSCVACHLEEPLD
jgi:hypothetical protein